MGKFLSLFTASLLSSAIPVAAAPVNPGADCIESPANAEGFALARSIVDTILPPDQQDQMMRQLMGAFNGQMQAALLDRSDQTDPELQAILDKFTASVPDRAMPLVSKHLPAIKLAMACAYTHNFSLEELRSVNQFAQSPTGKHYFGASLTMVNDPAIVVANGIYFKDVKQLLGVMQGELLRDISAYNDSKTKPVRSKRKSGS